MKPWNILVTGSSGLIGSEAVEYFDRQGHIVTGVDNNMRRVFFGPPGDTLWNLERLKNATRHFRHVPLDIRDRDAVLALFRENRFDLIIHCAAQPSHDKAAEIAFLDFDVNAMGTVNLLEAARQHCRDSAFIFMSTNKVYGDAPNEKPLTETPTRYDYSDPADYEGIDEGCRIDRTTHSLFGASKVAADIYAQEYGRYFQMLVGVFRGGCLTGPSHSGVELHGFLSYLLKVALSGKAYTVFGYKGKQVRDNIHSFDLVEAFAEFIRAPRSGEVYNIGGSRHSNCSMLEAIEMCEKISGKKLNWSYEETNRLGDHIWWISDVRKFQQHYPQWKFRYGMREILEEIHHAVKL
jgi:CDP-paratose 2-epimerase